MDIKTLLHNCFAKNLNVVLRYLTKEKDIEIEKTFKDLSKHMVISKCMIGL
jgi:hypothetical protein